MTFAICWERGDMSALAGSLQSVDLSSTLRNEARRYINGGLGNWASSPAGTLDNSICPTCHIVTCTYGTIPALITLIRQISSYLQGLGQNTDSVRYLLALADDLSAPPVGNNSSGKDPYP